MSGKTQNCEPKQSPDFGAKAVFTLTVLPVKFRRMNKPEFEKRLISFFGSLNYAFANAESLHQKQEWQAGISELRKLSDILAAKGGLRMQFLLFIYADDLSDEAMIGKCHLIQGKLHLFKKFVGSIGWQSQPIMASVFFVFEDSSKAFHYRQSVQGQCKHHGMTIVVSGKWVLPWGIDLSAKSVWGYKGLPLSFLKSEKIEQALFS